MLHCFKNADEGGNEMGERAKYGFQKPLNKIAACWAEAKVMMLGSEVVVVYESA